MQEAATNTVWDEPLGALPAGLGTTRFRVWAPRAERVAVALNGEQHPLAPVGDGVHEGEAPARPGDDYRFVLDGDGPWPDPWSRRQPAGVRGPSRIVDTAAFAIAPGPELPLGELVLDELHVGTFSAAGTFDGVVPHLAELRELGVTAIELMPVGTFPGERGWGYDGLYAFAPHEAYGGPAGLARLGDAAHRAGLGVVLDVVYNHLGPGSEALEAFGAYLADLGATAWGDTLDYSRRALREWALRNAELWVRDYRIDGLRLDAVHAVADDSEPHALAHELRRPQGARIVACAQNHDQVGNRALGDRLPAAKLRVAQAVVLFSAYTPLLFQGEEWAEPAPFRFFADHVDPFVADATREGRRREFAGFAGFVGEVPDPQARETFEASKLTRRCHEGHRAFVRDLLALRRELPRELEVVAADDAARTLTLRRGTVTLHADFVCERVEVRR